MGIKATRKLTERQVIAVLGAKDPNVKVGRNAPPDQLSARNIAKRLGVSYSTVCRIWQGRTYKEVYKKFHADAHKPEA